MPDIPDISDVLAEEARFCVICNEPGPDLRRLTLGNSYALDEGSHKLDKVLVSPFQSPFYTAVTCKDCRADFNRVLWLWLAGEFLDTPGRNQTADRNIPVRDAGGISWLTADEYASRYPDRTTTPPQDQS